MSISRKNDRIIRILMAAFVVIHTVLSLFGCIDDYTIYHVLPNQLLPEGMVLNETVGNCGVMNCIIGAASLLFLFLNKRNFYLTGFWLRLVAAIVSFAEPKFREFCDSTLMTGLARHDWRFTIQGYVVQVLAVILIIAFAGMVFVKNGEQE